MGNKPRSKTKGTTRQKTRSRQQAPSRPQTRTRQAASPPSSRAWLRPALIVVGAVVVVGALVFAFGGLESSDVEPPEGVEAFGDQTRVHTEDALARDPIPPVGGAHNPEWLNCGYYSAPVPNEYAVHSMEHGAVWIAYQPELDDASVDRLRDIAEEPKVIVSPYPGLIAPVVASSWGNQLRLDGADDPRLRDFVRAFKDGPDTPEPGGACFGGVGNPE